MHKIFPIVINACLVILIICGVAGYLHSRASPACNEHYKADTQVKFKGQLLKAQNAVTLTQLEQGLGGRQCLPSGQAMLFMFDKPDYYSFWMKNMRFPIDIVWLSPTKKVVTVEQSVSPSSYPQSFTSTKPSKYVIELGANQSDSLGLVTGTQVSF